MKTAVGLAIRIPDGPKALSRIMDTKTLPLYGRPHKLAIPSGIVALVQGNGHVVLTARAKRLSEVNSVRLITGSFRSPVICFT